MAPSVLTSIVAGVGRPQGSSTITTCTSPPKALATVSMKPGPPSDTGSTSMLSCGAPKDQPRAIAAAASAGASRPAYPSGAMSTRTGDITP